MFVRGYLLSLFCALLLPALLIADSHSGQLLVGHIKVLQELKDRFAAKKTNTKKPKKTDGRMTQTEAFLSIHKANVDSKWSYELKKYKAIIDQAMAREREFLDTHYVLYHGQRNELCLLQDFLKELFHLMQIHATAKDFEMMRTWFDALEKVEVNDYLNRNGVWQYNGKDVICANLSLFGNLYNSTSCTFHYFISDFNLNPFGPEQFLKEIFKHFGFDQKNVDLLLKLIKNIRTSEGRLFQVFIPKKKIDQFVYLSSTGATPWPSPIVSREYDHALRRHRSIAPILELYQTNPSAIQSIDSLQARIICSKNLMLNPKSGIKIFEYTTIPQSKFEDYHKNLAQITEDIVASWAVKNGTWRSLQMPASSTVMPLAKLHNYMLKDGHTFYDPQTKPKGFMAPITSLVKSAKNKIFPK